MSVIDHISSFQHRPHGLYVALVIPWSLLPGAMIDSRKGLFICHGSSDSPAPGWQEDCPLKALDIQMDWQHP